MRRGGGQAQCSPIKPGTGSVPSADGRGSEVGTDSPQVEQAYREDRRQSRAVLPGRGQDVEWYQAGRQPLRAETPTRTGRIFVNTSRAGSSRCESPGGSNPHFSRIRNKNISIWKSGKYLQICIDIYIMH